MMADARRWLRTLRIVRKRVLAAAPPPGQYLLVVTPLAAAPGSPLHVESGSDPWCLLDRGGETVRRRGVPCIMSVHDLDVADLDLGTVAWLPVDAEGHAKVLPPQTEADGGTTDMTDARTPTDAPLDPGALLARHKASGEPLDTEEVSGIVAAGLARTDEFDMIGGGLHVHRPSWPEPADDTGGLPVIAAGDPCPACGGSVVVDGARRYVAAPIHADGTDTDEAANGGDFEWSESGPYCRDCGVRVEVEF